MKILPKLKQNAPYILQGVFLAAFISSVVFLYTQNTKLQKLTQEVDKTTELAGTFTQNYSEALFADHIKIQENLKLTAELNLLQAEMEELVAKDTNEEYLALVDMYKSYNLYREQLTKNTDVGLDTTEFQIDTANIGEQLLNKEYSAITDSLAEKNTGLTDQYKEYLASLPPPATGGGEGYSYATVNTEKGTFGVYLIKVPLSGVRVVTASAYGDDCSDGCATKSLAQHIADNGGYAGMNSAYFCPPDYASCSGKVNSTDFAFYHSGGGKWLQKDALSWGDTGLATFNGNSAKFYKKSSDYGGGSVTAGVSNYPTLLDNGEVVVDSDDLTSYQKDVRGPRGAIGVGNENLYLAIVANATVIDAAYAMKALGALDALNLDGGGSSAMYINGGYVVGPGRSLPNAIVLVR